MSSPRQDILANVIATLQGITVANGFHTDVAKVEPVIRGWDDGEANPKPWIGVMVRRPSFDYQPCNEIDVTLPIVIVCHLSAQDRGQAVSDLEEDIVRALSADTRRGGNAILTNIVESGADDAAPEYEASNGDQVTLEVVAEIKYQRTARS